MNENISTDHLLKGGWRVSDKQSETTITLGVDEKHLLRKHLFRLGIDAVEGGNLLFTVGADNDSIPTPLHQGSSIFVWATERLQITRTPESKGRSLVGHWEVVQEPPIDYIATNFNVFPDKDSALVAAFESLNKDATPTEFVLEIFRSNGSEEDDRIFSVWIDGKRVMRSGEKPYYLLPGSSVIGCGGRVGIKYEGKNKETAAVTGRIKIARKSFASQIAETPG